jgi:hypothetical protein
LCQHFGHQLRKFIIVPATLDVVEKPIVAQAQQSGVKQFKRIDVIAE